MTARGQGVDAGRLVEDFVTVASAFEGLAGVLVGLFAQAQAGAKHATADPRRRQVRKETDDLAEDVDGFAGSAQALSQDASLVEAGRQRIGVDPDRLLEVLERSCRV